jgi:cytochrome c-type protein NapB
MEGNKCLSCHGVDTFVKKKATLVSETHFKDRDGKKLDTVSASRYSCTQCHVEQRVTEPLVGNEYKPASALE